MKPQDVAFIAFLAFLIWKRDPRLLVIIGLLALILAIPLFATWTFFTAERLTWYAAAFLLFSIVLQFLKNREK